MAAGGARGAWSAAWMREHLGLPDPETIGIVEELLALGLAALTEPTNSGYKYVYKSGERWQAKSYVKPGVQRGLGTFDTKEEAAEEIISLAYEGLPLPPTPKPRGKRGAGRQPRVRTKRPRAARVVVVAPLPQSSAGRLVFVDAVAGLDACAPTVVAEAAAWPSPEAS